MNLVISPNKRYSLASRCKALTRQGYSCLSSSNAAADNDKRDSKLKPNCRAFSLVSGVQKNLSGFVIDSGKTGQWGCMMRLISFPVGVKSPFSECPSPFKGLGGSSAQDCPLV